MQSFKAFKGIVLLDHASIGVQPGVLNKAIIVLSVLGFGDISPIQVDPEEGKKWCFMGAHKAIQLLEVPDYLDGDSAGNHVCLLLGNQDPTTVNASVLARLTKRYGITATIEPAGENKYFLRVPSVFQQPIELKYAVD